MTQLQQQIEAAIKVGLQARGTGSKCGAGRAYVCMSKVERSVLNAWKAAVAACGHRYLSEAYGAGNRAMYVGYDNFTGTPMAQAEAIAQELKAIGLPAYADGASD